MDLVNESKHNVVNSNANHLFDYTSSLTYIHDRPTWYWISMAFISVITTLGNSLVISLICSKKSMRSKVSPNWFILSLGVADFLVGAFNIPSLLLCRFTTICSFASLSILYCFISFFLTTATVNLCLLTFDVYLGVFHPFFYPNIMYHSRARLLIVLTWLFSAILNIPMFISVRNSNRAGLADQVLTLIYSASSSVFLVLAYARIVKVVIAHRLDIKKHHTQLASNSLSMESGLTTTSSSAGTRDEQMCRKIRDGTITATGVVTFIFLVCNGFWQYYLLGRIWPRFFPISLPVIYVVRVMLYCTSTMNFVVYALLRKDLRKELESHFKKVYNKAVSRWIPPTI